ncbi:MAG: hypothetical protein HZC29_09450, partial [Thaumarchaeota archaeon]|nr:hypothetical protein [Nitrososphaerota archaeon]
MFIAINGSQSDQLYQYENITNSTAWNTMTGQSIIFNFYRNTSTTSSLITGSSDIQRLGVDTYIYVYNTTGNQNYSSGSVTRSLTIAQKTPNITISASPSWSNVYPTVTTVSCSIISINNEASCNIWRDGVNKESSETITLGVGSYVYKANSSATVNYSSATTDNIMTINQNQTNPVDLIFRNSTGEYKNQNMTIVYGTQSNATAKAIYSNSGTINLYRDSAVTSGTSPQSEVATLGVNTHAYKVNITGNTNYTSNSTGVTYYIIVNKATPSTALLTNGTLIEQNSTINITAFASDTALATTIYANFTGELQNITPPTVGTNTNITGTSTLSFGIYQISANVTGNSNYTSNPTLQTVYINITDLPPRIQEVNASEITAGENLIINISAVDVSTDKVIVEVEYPNGTKTNLTASPTRGRFVVNITETQEVGEYIVKVIANDTSGNVNQSIISTGVIVPITFNITLKDAENNAIDADVNFYKPKTGSLATTLSTNASTGKFNGTVNSYGYMDVAIEAFNTDIRFNRVNLTTNVTNPLQLDDVPTTEIGSGGVRLKAIGINTSLNYTNVTITINYTGTNYQSEGHIGVYRCSNWNISARTCNSTWTRLVGTLNTINNTISTTVTSLSAYVVAEYICGDSSCESSYGESCGNCPTDCGICTTGPPPSGGGVSDSGGGGGAIIQEGKEVKPGYSISITKIEKRMNRGEFGTETITFTNYNSSKTTLSLSLKGAVGEFIFIEKEKIDVGPNNATEIKLKFFVDPTTQPGVYTGSLELKGSGVDKTIPITLIVTSEKRKLLDLSTEVLTTKVNPGQILRYRVQMFNLGTEERYDVYLNYEIIELATNKTVIAKDETIALQTSLSVVRGIDLPITLSSGEYQLKTTARYDNASATSSTN